MPTGKLGTVCSPAGYANKAALVTQNMGDFRRFPGLRVADRFGA